jgi:hypothetical protein
MTQKDIKEFLKLPKNERAVIIAKDVIVQIKGGIYKTNTGRYTSCFIKEEFRPENNIDYRYTDIYMKERRKLENSDACEIINNMDPKAITCQGCARASLFISSVKFKNKLTVGQVFGARFDYKDSDYNNDKPGDGTKYLSEEFSETQQSLIESCYEGRFIGPDYMEKTDGGVKSAIDFRKKVLQKYKKYYLSETPKKKLRKLDFLLVEICKNIIKNDGQFKP